VATLMARSAAGVPSRLTLALPYPVYVMPGSLSSTGTVAAACVQGRRCLVVTDPRVAHLYLPEVRNSLEGAGFSTATALIRGGEQAKRLAAVEDLARRAVRAGLDRQSLVVGLGGGVVTDVAGFLASVLLRGVAWLSVPTSLVGQLDAGLGGKTGVDLPEGKNLVGRFADPAAVLVDPAVLHTLGAPDISSGLVEAVKYGVIANREIIAKLLQNSGEMPVNNPKLLENIVRMGIEVKAETVSRDPGESGERAVLNFGHTLGHAIEQASGYRVAHGTAVARGMRGAAAVSGRRGWLSAAERQEVDRCLRAVGAFRARVDVDPTAVRRALARDKKSRGGVVRWVLAGPLGRARFGQVLIPAEVSLALRTALEAPP
jgi:3-dehydroquinate synthase